MDMNDVPAMSALIAASFTPSVRRKEMISMPWCIATLGDSLGIPSITHQSGPQANERSRTLLSSKLLGNIESSRGTVRLCVLVMETNYLACS